ncbi:MAG: hypothetical protein RIF32_00220, partial [Leptospirales bacterium]
LISPLKAQEPGANPEPTEAIETDDSEIDGGPNGRFVIAGYGNARYTSFSNETNNDTFSAGFTPIFLYRISDDLHAEAEIGVSVEAETGKAEVELEYTDLHYYLTNTTTITMGKYLLPFAKFGPNLHPSWINPLPSSPAMYAGHGSTSPVSGFLPVFNDFGAGIQQIIPLSARHRIFLDGFIANGPRQATGDDGHGDDDADAHGETTATSFPAPNWDREINDHWATELNFDANPGNINRELARGGRVAYAYLPLFEAGASYYESEWKERDDRTLNIKFEEFQRSGAVAQLGQGFYRAYALDLALISEFWSFRMEYARSTNQLPQTFPSFSPENNRLPLPDQRAAGGYGEFTFSPGIFGIDWLAGLQLVGRYDRVTFFDREKRFVNIAKDVFTVFNDRTEEQITFGLNYWVAPTAVIKFAVENNRLPDEHDLAKTGRDYNRVLFELAYGF